MGEELESFGSKVPFAEPYWYRDGLCSPFYDKSHAELRARIRAFVDKEIVPYADQWDEEGDIPNEALLKAYEAGVYATPWNPDDIGFKQQGYIPNFDAFHDFIWLDELARCGASGISAAFTIITMALPPILMLGSKEMKERVVRDVVTAKKHIALCISEPTAGSDVGNLQTTGVLHGDHYVLNGQKKWITRGKVADYFTVACRTGNKGMGGISLLLVERSMPGVSVRPLPLTGNWCAGTSLVTFDDVKVPVGNLIGKENEGFKAIMFNFNHERFTIAVQSNRGSRAVLEETIQYARERKTFGKRLLDHQVIRFKLMEMALRVESTHAYLEQFAYQMKSGAPPAAIASMAALAKVQAARTAEYVSREASQIFGGASYVRGGKGQHAERFVRESRAMCIYGGSEEIMLDLAARQARL